MHLLLLLFISTQALFAQENRFTTGVVKSDEGDPLPGVVVQLVGTTTYAITNEEGAFKLRVPAQGGELEVSSIGMKKKIVPIEEASSMTITLETDVSLLETVIITGYGDKKKEIDLVGSYAQVDAEDLQTQRPVESFDKLLNGLIAGVQAEIDTGEPGLPVRVRIRGEGSFVPVAGNDFATSGQPLYVLDGIPLYDITERNTANSPFSDVVEQKLNPLATLNPNDIASITVLKDASASAIYGANAANGVVLIKTKQGVAGKSIINFNMNYGVASPINPIQYLNSDEYVTLYRETLFNTGGNPSLVEDNEVDTDWRDLVTRTGTNLNANLSISGGNEKTRFRFSSGFFDQETISKGNSLQRISFRATLGHEVTDRLNLSFIVGSSFQTKESFKSFASFTYPPNISPYNSDGSFNNEGFFLNRPNPVAALEQNEFSHRGFATNGNLTLSYQLLPSLQLRSTLGVDYYQNRQNEFRSANNGSGRSRNGYGNQVDRNNLKWISFSQLVWNKSFSVKHQVSALAGFEVQEQTTSLLRAFGTNFPFDGLRQLSTVSAEDSGVASSDQEEAIVSYYGQFNYTFKNTYLASFNLRRDASSVFGGDVQNANFASAGVAWIVSNESFLSSIRPLSLLKLRLTYGTTGNARIGTYAARGLYRFSSGAQYGGLPGSAPSAAPNDQLSWETNRKLDIGIDLALFNGRLSLTVDHYQNRIFDAISTIEVPQESGFTSIPANTGNMENIGWEFTLNTINIQSENVTWRTNFNIAFNRNRVSRVALERPPRSTNQSSGIVVGQDINAIYGVRYAGADPYNGQPLWYLPDGSITDDARVANLVENRVVIGSRSPDFFGGFTNQLSYKGFSLSILTTFSVGSQILLSNESMTDGRQIQFNNQSVNQLDRWQQPGDVTDVPRLNEGNFPAVNNTRFLFDNTYLKFDNIRLGYQLPQDWLKKFNIGGFEVYAQVTNAGYLYSTTAPNNRNSIAEYRFIFPESRTYSTGLNVTF